MAESLQDVRKKILAEIPPGGLRRYKAEDAISLIETGLNELRVLGYSYVLERGELVSPVEYPKMFYHDIHGTLIVHSKEAANNLSDGWRDTPELKKPQESTEIKEDDNSKPLEAAKIFTMSTDEKPDSKQSASKGK